MNRSGIKVFSIFISVLLLFNLAGCGGGKPKNLKAAYKDYFPIGVALATTTYDLYSDELYENFSSVSHENALKWESVQSKEGEFTYKSADKIVDFALSKDMAVRGHTLLWHSQTPSWVFYDDNNALTDYETLQARLGEHIKNVVGKYKDKINVWDVCNEVLSDNSSELYRNESGDKTKESLWRQICGSDEKFEDLLAFAFKEAKKAAPNAKLYYNDYNMTLPHRITSAVKMIKNLRALGAQIDGVGEQGHYTIYEYKEQELINAIEAYALEGLAFQITELDVSMYASTDSRNPHLEAPTQEMLEKQAVVYESIFKVCRERKDNVKSITVWGMADDNTWLDNWPVANRKNWPLLFDEFGKPKLCYKRILNF